MEILYEFTFDSAHYLPNYVGKCKQLHGHTYTLKVAVDGHINPDTGMVMDFNQLKHIIQTRVIDTLDHTLLNDTIENPTSENVLLWIQDIIQPKLGTNLKLQLREGKGGYVRLGV